jgi:hypothetical protein
MRDNAVVSTTGPKPTVYITTRGGHAHHFTDTGQLTDWLAERPGFPFPTILDDFLAALDVAGVRHQAVNRSATVDEALAAVANINDRRTA